MHLLAIAGRLGVSLTIDDFDRIGAEVPLLANLLPAGHHLMDDSFSIARAGGLLAVFREVHDLLDPSAITVTGRPLVDHLDGAEIWDTDVIRPRDSPLMSDAGIAVLRGNLAPGGALVKPAAASPPTSTVATRSCSIRSNSAPRIDDPDLDVDADSVLVLRGCGPKGYPGMPEVSNMPLPQKLLRGRPRHGACVRRPDERHCVRRRWCCTWCPRRRRADRCRSCVPASWIVLDVPAPGSTST